MNVTSDSHDTILVIGFLCYDLIFTTNEYPEEDALARAVDYHKRRGGNASNSCTVLSQLGAKCELLAPMANDENATWMQNDLRDNNIIFYNCPIYNGWISPFTSIALSLATGSRTIIQYRPKGFPETNANDFCKLNLSTYKWIHFEARSIPETLKMIDFLDKWAEGKKKGNLSYSIELEKCTEETKELIPKGDFIFVAKEYAKFLGYSSPLSALQGLASQVKPGASIIIPWGSEGAFARCSNGEIVQAKSYPPPAILDSTGAGDTFIAATIFYLSQQKSLTESIDFGCRIAGAKCGMVGFSGIHKVFQQIKKDGS